MTNKIVTSPAERLLALSDSFKNVLALGKRYVDLLDQLAKTDQPADLLQAAQQLVSLDLDNAFINFPQHYQAVDYYMLFMGRLLMLSGVDSVKVKENASHQFEATIDSLGERNRFRFVIDQSGEAAFTEEDQQQPLFYINLTDRIFQFNNCALVNYFIVYALKQSTDLELRDTVKPLIKFAEVLADQLDFSIDLGILDTHNDQRFKLRHNNLKLTVIDRLFVKTAETDYMLMNLPHNSGAELVLDQGIKLDLSFDPDSYSQEWAFQVKDPGEQVSFFDILLHYTLVRQWYLNDRQSLAVESVQLLDDELADQPTEPIAEQPAGEESQDKSEDNESAIDKNDSAEEIEDEN